MPSKSPHDGEPEDPEGETSENRASSDSVPAILEDTTGNQRWEIRAPLRKPAAILLRTILRNTNQPQRDSVGNIIPYYLYYKEAERMLGEGETLEAVDFRAQHTLVFMQHARAGKARA